MQRLSVDDLHAFHHAVLDLHRYRDLDEFLEFAPRVLSRLIPSARFAILPPDSDQGTPRLALRSGVGRTQLPAYDDLAWSLSADLSSKRELERLRELDSGTGLKQPRDFILLELLQPHLELACTNARRVTESRTASRSRNIGDYGLTPREADVAKWLAAGKTNAEIAKILNNVSSRTIEKHVERVLLKMGVENRTAAALLISLVQKR